MAFREGINEELFEVALDFIDKHPRSFDMSDWERETKCGSVFCLAGVVNILCGEENRDGLVPPRVAANHLGLLGIEPPALFVSCSWPSKFSRDLDKLSIGTPEYKDVAIRRFRHFLATGE